MIFQQAMFDICMSVCIIYIYTRIVAHGLRWMATSSSSGPLPFFSIDIALEAGCTISTSNDCSSRPTTAKQAADLDIENTTTPEASASAILQEIKTLVGPTNPRKKKSKTLCEELCRTTLPTPTGSSWHMDQLFHSYGGWWAPWPSAPAATMDTEPCHICESSWQYSDHWASGIGWPWRSISMCPDQQGHWAWLHSAQFMQFRPSCNGQSELHTTAQIGCARARILDTQRRIGSAHLQAEGSPRRSYFIQKYPHFVSCWQNAAPLYSSETKQLVWSLPAGTATRWSTTHSCVYRCSSMPSLFALALEPRLLRGFDLLGPDRSILSSSSSAVSGRVMGWSHYCSRGAANGLSADILQDLYAHLRSPPAIARAGLPHHARKCIASTKLWYAFSSARAGRGGSDKTRDPSGRFLRRCRVFIFVGPLFESSTRQTPLRRSWCWHPWSSWPPHRFVWQSICFSCGVYPLFGAYMDGWYVSLHRCTHSHRSGKPSLSCGRTSPTWLWSSCDDPQLEGRENGASFCMSRPRLSSCQTEAFWPDGKWTSPDSWWTSQLPLACGRVVYPFGLCCPS